MFFNSLKNRLIFILSLCFVFGSAVARERLIYAWQEYDPKNTADNDTTKGFVYSQVENQSKETVAENAIYPSVSSDGREVVYSEKQGEGYAIVLRNLVTGESEEWTAAGFNLMADLSGNGRYLAFSGPYGAEYTDRTGKTAKSNQIAIIDLWKSRKTQFILSDKIPKRKIYRVTPEMIPTEGRAFFPELSSDGRYVVFHESFGFTDGSGKKAQSKRIVVYDRHTKESKIISGEKDYCFEPTISFDDRYIASVCRVNENGKDNDDIYLFDRLNLQSPRVRITNDPGRDYAPTFRANSTIVFSSDRGQRDQEFRLYQAIRSFDGRYEEKGILVDGPGVHYVPSFSGDIDLGQNVTSSDLNHARSSFGVADMNGTPIVIGGNQGKQHDHSENAIVASSEILKDGKWFDDASLVRPTKSQGFEAFYYNQKVFVIGGLVPENNFHGTYSLDFADVYDTQKKSWGEQIKLSYPRSSFAASQLGSKVYLFYGWSSQGDFMGEYIPKGEVLNLATQRVEGEFDLPRPYRRGFATVVWKDKIILVGGFADTNFINQVDVFDPQAIDTDLMIQHFPPLPLGLFSPTAAVDGDTLYVFGGVSPYGSSIHSDSLYTSHVYRLDLKNPSKGWVHTGRYMHESKAFLRALPYRSPNQLYLIGGHGFEIGRENNFPVTTTEIWSLTDISNR